MPGRYSKEQHLEMSRAAWDEGHRYLAKKRSETPDWGAEFRDGHVEFTALEIELFGEISGLDVLQLSCAGDANQAFSLANMGATVTACDFSSIAIEEARGHAARLGLDVRFAVDDSQRLATFADDLFDLVHVDGNLWYYEDLPTACRNWHRVLKPGGRLILHEGHPFTRCLEEDETSGHLTVAQPYGDKTPEYALFRIADFVSETLEEVDFPHTLADILNAIMQAGFTMKKMVECNADQASFGAENLGKSAAVLPNDFHVIAQKDYRL